MEFKLDFKNIFHNLRYNIEFVKINNKKYARGWGIRYLYAIIHIINQSKDNHWLNQLYHFTDTSQLCLSSRPAP